MPHYTTRVHSVELNPQGGFTIVIPSVLPLYAELRNFRTDPVVGDVTAGSISTEWIRINVRALPHLKGGDEITFIGDPNVSFTA
jgi:hypothetical protein